MPALRTRSRARTATPPPAAEDSPGPDFARRVYDLVRLVPEGRVASYGDVAKYLGFPKHSRMVGSALKCLPRHLAMPVIVPAQADDVDVEPAPEPNPDFVPWHRIVNSSGIISPRGNDMSVRRQADYLRAEGVQVADPSPRHARPNVGDPFAMAGATGASGGKVDMNTYRWQGPPPPQRS